MLLGHKNGERVSFRFEYTKDGMMEMVKYLVDDKAAITTRLKEMKKPTIAKLELEKERLYESLEGLPLSEKLKAYGQISDVLLRIEKLSKLSEMIENYMRIARKLSNEFDIILAKELFSLIIIIELNMNLVISLGGNDLIVIPTKQDHIYKFTKTIKHLFKHKLIEISLYVN